MQSLTWTEVRAQRLRRSYLTAPAAPEDLAAVVGAVGGIQAQIMSAAELAIGVRVAGITQQQVRAALWDERRLVRTYGPRETLHLVPASDLPLWMAAMRSSPGGDDQWWTTHHLTPAEGEALVAAIREALDSRCLTRDALAAAVGERLGDWAQARLATTWADLIIPAAYAGALCFGPNQGSKVTFVRPDQWLGGWHDHEPRAALVEVVRRYLAVYGPATRRDIARWVGLDPRVIAAAASVLERELEQVDIDGHPAWRLASDEDADGRDAGPTQLRLLPQYDSYVLGSYPRDQIVPSAAKARIASHGRGRFEGAAGVPVLLIDGMVAGIWKKEGRGRTITVGVEPVRRLSRAERDALAEEAEWIARFLDATVTLVVGPIST